MEKSDKVYVKYGCKSIKLSHIFECDNVHHLTLPISDLQFLKIVGVSEEVIVWQEQTAIGKEE